MKYGGVLPSQDIKTLVENDFIKNADPKSICTDTYDPSISDEIYRLSGAFLPPHGKNVRDMIAKFGTRIKHDSILERGVYYIARIREEIAEVLPDDTYAYSNPKSNIGRVDILTRLLANGTSSYDRIPKGYVGELWSLINPRSFSVIAGEGVSFNQIRFFTQDTRLDEFRLEAIFNKQAMVYSRVGKQIKYQNLEHTDEDGSILLNLGLDFSRVGFEAIENGEPINLKLSNHYEPREFFREIHASKDYLGFGPHLFRILSTEESIRVPDSLTCEMRPTDARRGEFRVHYAGYIAPGWGLGPDGTACGRPLTLEVRSFETSFVVMRGQPFAKIRFERMKEVPEVHYDQQPGVKFKVQDGPGLAKYFKQW